MIFGLSYRSHTLCNLFYMMVYNSLFILPFYLTLNFFRLDPVYIFNFGAFVISSNTLTLMLTAFFTEHKVATEVIGTIFSLGSFLPLVYDSNSTNLYHYLAMFFPNSAFAIAIMTKDASEQWRVSLACLSISKLYLLIYYAVEFGDDLKSKLKWCVSKLRVLCRRDPAPRM